MDGVVASLAVVFVGVLVALTRAAVVLTVVAIVVLTYAGVRLLLAMGPALCRRLDALPPDPLRAVSAGVAFSISGCPGCAPVAAAVGTAAAAAGPLVSMLVIAGFVVGRAGTLYAAAAAGGRWLVPDDPLSRTVAVSAGSWTARRDRSAAPSARSLAKGATNASAVGSSPVVSGGA